MGSEGEEKGSSIDLRELVQKGSLTLGPQETDVERSARLAQAAAEHAEEVRQRRWRFNAFLAVLVVAFLASAGCGFLLDGEHQRLGADLTKLIAGGVVGYLVGQKKQEKAG